MSRTCCSFSGEPVNSTELFAKESPRTHCMSGASRQAKLQRRMVVGTLRRARHFTPSEPMFTRFPVARASQRSSGAVQTPSMGTLRHPTRLQVIPGRLSSIAAAILSKGAAAARNRPRQRPTCLVRSSPTPPHSSYSARSVKRGRWWGRWGRWWGRCFEDLPLHDLP